MYVIYQITLFSVLIQQYFCQQSSVQIQKIEADPPNPNVGESLKIRCFLINVDPFAQYPTQLIWSIRRFSKNKFEKNEINNLNHIKFYFQIKKAIFVC